ncbi:MAG: hypothetical protein KBG42_02935 [Lachnospiraceae bacterium]|nr:hypothetical protein [Lachnospiraceae bacterium]
MNKGENLNIEREVTAAKKGYEIWEAIKAKYKMGYYDFAVSFPTEYDELNKAALSHVQRFAKTKYYKRIIIIMLDTYRVPQNICDGKATVEYEYLDNEKMTSLIYFLRLININDQMIVVSADEPFGNLNLLGKHSITMDDYVEGTYI